MPVYHKLVDYNQMFSYLKEEPTIINDLPNTTEEERRAIDDLIVTRYSSDMLSMVPSCRCGDTKGEYSIGVVCEYCKTPVTKVDEDIHPLLWFRRPKGVAQLINPAVFNMLRDRFKMSSFNVIDWLIDTTFHTYRKTPDVLNTILEAGIQRGYNYFVDNFDTIMEVLFSIRKYKKKRGERDYLYELLQRDRHLIFSDYIPLPNRSLLIIENTNVGKYIDPTIIGARNAINMIVSIDRKFGNHPLRVRENRTAKSMAKLADFYIQFTAKNISPKPGLIRRHVIGSRAFFCFRAVITSITRPHQYNQIEIPWLVGVTVLREHLLSKMLKKGFELSQAINYMYARVHTYDSLLDGILDEIFSESPNGTIPCILQRNLK